MSRLNAPPPDPARTRGKGFGPILRHRKKRPLHPYTIRDLIYERSKLDRVEHVYEGWLLIFYESDGVKHFVDVNFIKEPDGTRRPATYADVVAIRDADMAKFSYESCWLIMKSVADSR